MTVSPQSGACDPPMTTALQCQFRPSPNFGPRRGGRRPDMILIHYTGMEDDDEALDWLCNPRSHVSAHYFVGADGTIIQLVDEAQRAWHAGESSWAGENDINSAAIGIEIANAGHDFGSPSFPEPQIAAVIALCRAIAARHGIRPERVLGHSDVAPGRKADPGERFPWYELAAAGIGHYVDPAPLTAGPVLKAGDTGAEIQSLQARLAAYGYGIAQSGRYDKETAAVVTALQRHFRPQRVDGIADPSTRETLENLLAALPKR